MDLMSIVSTYGIAIVAALAFVVSVITEVIKNLGPLSNVPTNLVVLLLSVVVTMVSYFGAVDCLAHAFVWYEAVAAFISSFIIAFVAMNGWDKMNDIWIKYKK